MVSAILMLPYARRFRHVDHAEAEKEQMLCFQQLTYDWHCKQVRLALLKQPCKAAWSPALSAGKPMSGFKWKLLHSGIANPLIMIARQADFRLPRC